MTAPELSIVLVSWNAKDDLDVCLRSLVEHTRGVEFEVIVVDNASSDGTVAALETEHPQVRVIANADNRGFAAGCNQGMAAARGELILLLNSDTYVVDNVIGRSVEALRARPDVGMLATRLAFPDGRLQHNANRALSVRHSLLERLWLYKLIPDDRRGKALMGGYWEHDEPAEVDWLAGAFMLLRRPLYTESGGFDERFWMYGEDSEWCMRLRRQGHKILYTPEPGTVFHTGSVSSDLVWTEKQRLRRCHVGGLESYAAVNGRARALAYRAAELVGSCVRFAAYWTALRIRPNDYYRHQAQFYSWLIEFFARPGRSEPR